MLLSIFKKKHIFSPALPSRGFKLIIRDWTELWYTVAAYDLNVSVILCDIQVR
jgi:hypothetical protein